MFVVATKSGLQALLPNPEEALIATSESNPTNHLSLIRSIVVHSPEMSICVFVKRIEKLQQLLDDFVFAFRKILKFL